MFQYMELYERILDDLYFSIIVWERVDESSDKYACTYSNNKVTAVQKGTLLDTYLDDNQLLRDKYTCLFETKRTQHIIDNKDLIVLTTLVDDIFYETRSPSIEVHDIQVLSSISTKIRGPLTSIIGIISILRETTLTKKQKKYLGIIQKSSYDIVTVANDLIDLLNLRRNQVTLNEEFITLENTLKKVVDIVEHNVKEQKLTITFNIDHNVPKIILVDGNKLEQILVKLITNSIKNTIMGGVNITVSLFDGTSDVPFEYETTVPPEYNIIFKIKDTGFGIPEPLHTDLRTMLATPVDMYATTKFELSGFGLLICKHLCELMQGNIWFSSTPEIGSIFYFNMICSGTK